MKKFFAYFAFTLLLFNSFKAQVSVNLTWGHAIGSYTFGPDDVDASVIDATGNIYITGWVSGNTDFDPSATTNSISATTAAFLAKYDANGGFLWAKVISSSAQVSGTAIAVDGSGNVYVTGSAGGSVLDFNPPSSTATVNLAPGSNMFVAKYSSSGAYIWGNVVGALSCSVKPYSLRVNTAGDIVIGGEYFASTPLNFALSGPSYTMPVSNIIDGFVAKYNNAGVMQWGFSIGGGANDYLTSVEIDASNNVYIGGNFQQTADFDPSSSGTVNISSNAGTQDAYVAKYDPSGNYLWASVLEGGPMEEIIYRMKLDNSGAGIVVTGLMESPVLDADPTAGTYTLSKSGAGQYDVLMAKYNTSNGHLVWAKNTGSSYKIIANGVTVDSQNNIYLTGEFEMLSDFDFSPTSSFTLSNQSAQYTDVFLAKYTSNGDFIFAKRFGGGSGQYNTGKSVNVDNANNIVLCGNISFSVNPDFQSSNPLPNDGSQDIFFVKYSQCIDADTPTLTVNSVTICANTVATLSISGGNLNSAANWVWMTGCGSSQISTGTTFTASPPFQSVYFVRGEGGCTNPGGCTSATISVTPSKDVTGVVTTSSTVFVPGTVELYRKEGPLTKWDFIAFQNVNASGVYTFNAVNAGNYIIKAVPTSPSLQTTYAPNVSTWKNAVPFTHGCATNLNMNIDVLALTDLGGGPGVLSGKITEGFGYGNRGGVFAPGQPIGGLSIKGGRNPGGNIVAQAKTNAAGEYTLSNLALSNTNENYFVFVDIPGLDTNGTYHKAVMTGSLQYGNLDFVVDSQYVNPTNFVGIKELSIDNQMISIYPNPAKNIIHISTEIKTSSEMKMELTDIYGKLILTKNFGTIEGEFNTSLNVADITRGIYFVRIQVNNSESRLKIVLSE